MNIVLGVTGSIAAHKSIDLASQLTHAGHRVHVVLTADAQRFVKGVAAGTGQGKQLLPTLRHRA
jgi:phosphopantothenoylcysteine synthetase/decarboxylase